MIRTILAALVALGLVSTAHAEAILVPADLEVVCVHSDRAMGRADGCPERLSKVPVVFVTSLGLVNDDSKAKIAALVQATKTITIVHPEDLVSMCKGSAANARTIACRERHVRSPEVLVISVALATPEVKKIIEGLRAQRLLALNQPK